jgi:DNA-binding CsgD family transcriptional regulator
MGGESRLPVDCDTIEVAGVRVFYLSAPIECDNTLPELTAAESAVARLAADGLSNAEIGRIRETSERTIANQLASIYKKLRVGSRVELVSFVDSSDRGSSAR